MKIEYKDTYPENTTHRGAHLLLPDEWTIKQSRVHTKITSELHEHNETHEDAKIPGEEQNLIISLSLCDSFSGIPGCDPDKKWDKWKLEEVPIDMIGWLVVEVLQPFDATFKLPKVL